MHAKVPTSHQNMYMKMQMNEAKNADTQIAESAKVLKVPRSIIRMYSGVPARG